VISLDAKDAVAHNDLGVVLLKKGAQDEAMKEFSEAISLRDGVYAQAWNNLGLARAFYGDLSAAMDALIQAQLASQKGTEAQIAMARENLHWVQNWASIQDAQAARQFRLSMVEGIRGGFLMLQPPMYPGTPTSVLAPAPFSLASPHSKSEAEAEQRLRRFAEKETARLESPGLARAYAEKQYWLGPYAATQAAMMQREYAMGYSQPYLGVNPYFPPGVPLAPAPVSEAPKRFPYKFVST
jgi:tetratricopeptide (TPR) repeat protein